MKTPKIYNLPHNLNYQIIGSYYTGGFNGEGYCSCDNCNAIISKIAILKDNFGKQYTVGFDCAKTLSSLNKDDIDDEMRLFKYGQSIRNSILKKLKVSAISVVSIIEKHTQWNIRLDSDNPFRNGYSTQISKDSLADKHTLPQLQDLVGTYIYNRRIDPAFLDELRYMLKPGMQTYGAYKMTIVSIDFENQSVIMRNNYMENSITQNDISTSKYSIDNVLANMFRSVPEIECKLIEKGILKQR